MSGQTTSAAFRSPERERAADTFGVWVFIGSEALLFGGLLLSYLVGRLRHGEGFAAGSHELSFWLGTVNTAILLTSSLTMALADAAAEGGAWRAARRLLLATAALGLAFLAIKFTEYREEIGKGFAPLLGIPLTVETPDPAGTALFGNLYFVMTGLHAVHLASGICVVAGIAWAWERTEPASRLRRVGSTGLYWHFVDVVWVFLYPLLYLVKP
jgi:cytochrome c oxidase subunit 3